MLDYNQTSKFRTFEEARKVLETLQESASLETGPTGIKKIKGFSKKDMLKKAEKDAVFFEHIFDEVIASNNPAIKNAYDRLITEAMLITGQILQEADIAPRTVSPVIDNHVLSEDEMIQHYKRSFNLILEQKFNEPNIKSKILFEDIDNGGAGNGGAGNGGNGTCVAKRILAPGVQGLMIRCAKAGILDNNDPEAVAKYLSAENAVTDAVSNTLIPNRVLNQISNYQNNLPQGYSNIFGNPLGDNLNAFQQIVAKISAVIAPFIFTNALSNAGISVQFDPAQVAGIGLDNNIN